MSAAVPVAPKDERCMSEFMEKPGRTHQCKLPRHHTDPHTCICLKTWRAAR